ncbi:MAG: N-acetylglucosamine-6-phosphate deacetylase [Lachnospiraceae bacterium]|nr:N-acetylglucosamine-6-phosphate deacetylase [Lachnospiraceae bacterium]
MRIRNALVYGVDRQFHEETICIRQGLFVPEDGAPDEQEIDASGCYALPGLIDIHFHGAMGADVCDGTMEAYETVARYELQHGITSMCPATLTLPEEVLCGVLFTGALFAKREEQDMARLVGFNMEGPFISHVKKGAQNEAYIRSCDAAMVRRFLDASEGLLKIIGLAPEINPEFVPYIAKVKEFVKVSLAHTDTDYATAMEAFTAGASHVVHLYNAMRGLHHREPGLVGAAADARATCELICDGIHVHPAAVRAAYDMMGPERIILISDTLRCTGMEDGIYDLGGQAVSKKGPYCNLVEEGNVAGSVSNLFDCLRNAVLTMEIPLEQAVASATILPARCIGEDDRIGAIADGMLGDLILVRKSDFSLQQVIKGGNLAK